MPTITISPELHRSSTDVRQQIAYDIATLMLPESFAAIKAKLGLTEPYALGTQTLTAFTQAFIDEGFDLSTAGVNSFKDGHHLSNSGILQGVIGPTTANVYARELLTALNAPPKTPPGRHINAAGLQLIKESEGCARYLPDRRITAYRDAVGVLTIGYGHTHGVYSGQIITQSEAEALLREDLATFEAGVAAAVKVPITDNQFAALVSFAFNLGLGTLRSSTMVKELNAGAPKATVAAHFGAYVNAGGKPLAGLIRRRAAEKALFLS